MFAVTLQYTAVQTSRTFGVERIGTDIKGSICILICVTVVAFAWRYRGTNKTIYAEKL